MNTQQNNFIGKLVYDEEYSRIGCVERKYDLYSTMQYYVINWSEERPDDLDMVYPETMIKRMIDALGKRYEQ